MYTLFNIRTIIRFGLIFILTIVLTSIVPGFPRNEELTYLTPIPVATIFAIVIAFYISNAIARMNNLQNNISIELSRARRIYHLANGFKSEPILKWAKELRVLVIKYLKGFAVHNFLEYGKSNENFRAMSYHIYEMDPRILKTPKEVALYEELLTTTREWAMVRQNLQELKKQKISLYNWFILFSISSILIFSLMLLRSQNLWSTKLASGFSIIAVLFILDLLWEINSLNSYKARRIARRYVADADVLENMHRSGQKKPAVK